MRRYTWAVGGLLLTACVASHVPEATDGGRELDGGAPDAVGVERDSGSARPEIECSTGWPMVVYASVRLECTSDGREALRMIVTPYPHRCDDALEQPRFDLLGWGRPMPEAFRAWYDDPKVEQGEARFCDEGGCRDVAAARWQMETFHLGATSPAGYAVICDPGSSVSGSVDASWCGPTSLSCAAPPMP